MSPDDAPDETDDRERRKVFGLLAVFYLLHNDLWQWNEPRLVLGLPAGLTYHVLYCFAAAWLLYLLVKHAWPSHLEDEPGA